MRWLSLALSAIAGAACYGPTPERDCALACTTSCPDGLVCSAGRCVSTVDVVCNGDPPLDAPPAKGCTFPTSFTAPVTLSALSSIDGTTRTYNTDAADTTAVFSTDGTIQLGTPRNQAGLTALAFEGPGAHLSPEGDELFIQVSTPEIRFAVSTKNAGVFANPTLLTINNLPLTDVDIPSTPTARGTEERRMMIGQAGGFVELRERSPRLWDVHARYTAAELELDSIAQPTLSPDGQRVVFLAEKSNGGIAIYGAQRATLADRFRAGDVVHLYDPAGGPEDHPFLGADCRHLYYFHTTSASVVQYVTATP